MFFQSLINNVAILLALSYLYILVSRQWRSDNLPGQLMHGLLFGLVTVGVMLTPFHLSPGLVFDTRSAVICVAGLFCGPVVAAITALFSITYRVWLGGVGVAPGIFSAVSAAALGSAFFYWRKNWQRPDHPLFFYLFGLLVHVAVLLGMFTLPAELAWPTIKRITLPVMVVYPLATLLLSLLLADQQRRLKVEQQLTASEKRFRSLFNQAGDAIFVSDFDGNFVNVNDAAVSSLGYSRQELLSMHVQDVDPNFPASEALQKFWTTRFAQEQGRSATFESHHRRKDGTTFPVEISAGFTDLQSQRLVMGFARDITERVQAEDERKRLKDQLLHAQKMEAVGTLAGGIAHEFNNILTAIVGYAELSLAMLEAKGKVQPDHLKEILNSAHRASDLIKRILTFSRKAEVVSFRLFDINSELSHAITILEKTIPREIKVEKELREGVGEIKGDPGQIEQVLLNLGTNAVHAMAGTGRLTVKTERVTIGDQPPNEVPEIKTGDYVLITVADTGQGMSAETVKQIFDPFFTTKEVGSGTGLGLAMVYGIVKGHHGYIACRSELGKGTSFLIYLPVSQQKDSLPADSQATASTPQLAAGHNEKILLVDDEEGLLAIGKEMLTSNGYHVLQAANGEEALVLYEWHGDDIALVLLDVSMPGMGGRRCLQKILQLNPAAKVLITSGYAIDDSIQEILAEGAKGFVAKPFSMQDLLDAVHQALAAEV